VPRTAAQLDVMLRDRPDNWEYLYFGGVLLAGVVRLQGKLRDQETQYVRPGARHMNDREVALFLGGEMDTLRSIVGNVSRIFNEPMLTAAFGAPDRRVTPNGSSILRTASYPSPSNSSTTRRVFVRSSCRPEPSR